MNVDIFYRCHIVLRCPRVCKRTLRRESLPDVGLVVIVLVPLQRFGHLVNLKLEPRSTL